MLRLPPPIWAMVFLGLTAAASWALDWPPIPWLPHHEAVGVTIFFVSWILPVLAFRSFRLMGTEIDPMSERNYALVTDGPYRLTRNPMYLGLTFATLGMAIWVGAWPMLISPLLVFSVCNWVHIPFEEAKMARQFGAEYEDYARRVRRWV